MPVRYITHESRGKHVAELKRYASTPGLARDQWLELNSKASDGAPVFTVRYGRTKVSVDSQGHPVAVLNVEVDEDGNEFQPGLTLEELKALVPGVSSYGSAQGSAPANKMIGDVTIPCGLVLIIGAGGHGKTPLSHALAQCGVESYALVAAGEPLAGYMSDEFQIACAIGESMVNMSDVVLDSIKDRLSEGSNPMKSGISRQALTMVSTWSAHACEMGVSLYVPVNPSVPDEEVVELLIEASRSNATATVTLVSSSSTESVWNVFHRTGEGLPRSQGTLTMRFDEEGLSYIVTDSRHRRGSPVDGSSKTVEINVSTETIGDSIRRALSIR